jgi:hypothetical protein
MGRGKTASYADFLLVMDQKSTFPRYSACPEWVYQGARPRPIF